MIDSKFLSRLVLPWSEYHIFDGTSLTGKREGAGKLASFVAFLLLLLRAVTKCSGSLYIARYVEGRSSNVVIPSKKDQDHDHDEQGTLSLKIR
jgi:hypothetical protein